LPRTSFAAIYIPRLPLCLAHVSGNSFTHAVTVARACVAFCCCCCVGHSPSSAAHGFFRCWVLRWTPLVRFTSRSLGPLVQGPEPLCITTRTNSWTHGSLPDMDTTLFGSWTSPPPVFAFCVHSSCTVRTTQDTPVTSRS